MSLTDSTSTDQLLQEVAAGDVRAIEELLSRHRSYVKQLIDVRMEPALRSRIDASDVVQDTFIVASRRIKEFVSQRPVSFRVWLRRNAMERLIETRRRHLADKRDARREIAVTDASSLAIAHTLMSRRIGDTLLRREMMDRVRAAMSELAPSDQEILLLRHAEGLTNNEAAEVLGIEPGTASKRYGRAIGRLSTQLRRLGFESM